MDLCLVLEHACNLRCDYCYTGQKKQASMSRETATRAIDFALQRGPETFSLSFFGGEPLLNRGVLEHAVRYADSRLKQSCFGAPWLTILSTNATLVNDEVATWLRTLPDFTGLRAHVSLDGPAFVHDMHRMHVDAVGSWAKTRAGIAQLKNLGIPVLPVATLCPDTAEFAGEMVTELLEVASSRASISVNLRAHWTPRDFEKLRVGLGAAGRVWAESLRALHPIVLEPFAEKILSHNQGGACSSRCQMALGEIVVAPSGRLYPCGEMVGEDVELRYDIGDLEHGFDHRRIAQLLEEKARVEGVCADCDLRERCSSHCGCQHIALTGKLGTITDTLCQVEAAFVDAADAVAESLYAEGCEAFLQLFYETPWQLIPGATLLRSRQPRVDSEAH